MLPPGSLAVASPPHDILDLLQYLRARAFIQLSGGGEDYAAKSRFHELNIGEGSELKRAKVEAGLSGYPSCSALQVHTQRKSGLKGSARLTSIDSSHP